MCGGEATVFVLNDTLRYTNDIASILEAPGIASAPAGMYWWAGDGKYPRH